MPDPMVHVVDVGDGACSLLRPWPEREPGRTAVIDCGVWRSRAAGATNRLLTALGGDLAHVESFVVSHFDWDHWGGLRNLHRFPATHRTLNSASLFYPHMPRALPATLYAMMGPLSGTGSAVLDLNSAMQPLLVPGHALSLHPLHSASDPVDLAGDDFDVIWPPRSLSREFSDAIHGAVAAAEKLADDLATAGYPQLQQNLNVANRAASEVGPFEVQSIRSEQPDQQAKSDGPLGLLPEQEGLAQATLDELMPEEVLPPFEEDEPHADWPDGDDHHPDDPDVERLRALPRAWQDRYRKVLRRVRAANNDLSLVLASQTGGLAAFGDIGGVALAAVLEELKGRRFAVTLAPHHGTHEYSPNMPRTQWCVAQGGRHHLRRWQTLHPAHHGAECWNTAVHGEFYGG